MAPTHPLEIPEILLHMTSYVPVKSLPTCARVSKSWYQAFVPAIWKEISLSDDSKIPFKAMQSQSHLVQSLVLVDLSQGPTPFIFPNLDSLSVLGPVVGTTKMILKHTSIRHMRLNDLRPSSGLWVKLLESLNLSRLEIGRIKIAQEHTAAFWQLCTHLEHLRVCDSEIVDRGQLSSMRLPRLKVFYLRLDRRHQLVSLFMDFLSRCPGLVSCVWATDRLNNDPFLPRFLELLHAKTWPDPHNLCIARRAMSPGNLSKILIGMQRITSLDLFCSPNSVKPKVIELLRPRFSGLVVLRLRSVDQRAVCPMAQEILSSCPSLESFQATRINAILVAEGNLWVCLGLKDLHLGFVFDPSTIRLVQPRVFDQLSRLTRLRELNLWSNGLPNDPAITPFRETVDLRLKNGLGKLSTLRALQRLEFDFSEQRMGNQEIDWILEHWRCLEWIHGILNKKDPEVDRTLRKRLMDHGLTVTGNFDNGSSDDSSSGDSSSDDLSSFDSSDDDLSSFDSSSEDPSSDESSTGDSSSYDSSNEDTSEWSSDSDNGGRG